MKNSYLTAGIRLRQLRLLLKNRPLSFSPETLFRLIFLAQSASWSSLFHRLEILRFKEKINASACTDDPLFIIGHWRTGSTLLHQFMACDPALHAPTLFEVAVPDSFLVSYPFYKPVFNRLVDKYRPMDMVRIGMDEPQEDEYAIFRLTGISPLADLVAPGKPHFFLSGAGNRVPSGPDTGEWIEKLRIFYRKLCLLHGKRIVSKNPFNSFRIPLLLQAFPHSKFIHIYRNPYHVVPSTVHMWKILQEQNRLNRIAGIPDIADIIPVMDDLLTAIEKDRPAIPVGHYAEIRFEELEKEPVESIRQLYSDLALPFPASFGDEIRKMGTGMNPFPKNSFTLTEDEKQVITTALAWHIERFGYNT